MSEETQQQSPAPAGPAGHFLFGSAADFYAGRLRFLERMATTYGDIARYRIGCDWYYLLNDPRVARDALRDWDHLDNATSDGGFHLDASFVAKNGRERIAPRSIVHSTVCPHAVAVTHERMVDVVEQMLEGWGDGQERDALADMMQLNIEITSSTLFGRPAASWLTPVMHVLTDLQMLVGAYTHSDVTRDRMQIKRRLGIFIEIEALVERFIADLPESSHGPALRIFRRAQAEGKMTEREVLHELCVLLLSASSTAIASIWSWYCLSQHPEVRSRLEAELDTLPPGRVTSEGLGQLPYLDAFLEEVLRLYPSLGVLHRKVESDWTRGSLHLAAGETVHISPYLLHRHPQFWHRPDEFRPERFDPESEWHHPKQGVAYFPFGVGVRRCIGEALAWQQLRIMIATVARRYRADIPTDYEVTYDVSPLGALHPDVFELPVHISQRPTACADTAASAQERA